MNQLRSLSGNYNPLAERTLAFCQTYLVIALLFASVVARAQTAAETTIPARPNPPRLVNDFVGILQPQQREALEEKLRRYNDSTSNQIAVVIVKTTEPYPIGDFAFQVLRQWGVGQKDKNNGLVLAWATQDRKIYISTGYGLEGAVPDAVANRIITEILRPAFKQEQYYEGLDAATTEIIKRAQGEYKAEPSAGTDDVGGASIVIIFLVVMLVFWLISRNNRGGGNRSRGGGGFMPVFLPTTFSGWGSSSGGFGGGGDSGGGFGGFGGGSGGGGGAGGDY